MAHAVLLVSIQLKLKWLTSWCKVLLAFDFLCLGPHWSKKSKVTDSLQQQPKCIKYISLMLYKFPQKGKKYQLGECKWLQEFCARVIRGPEGGNGQVSVEADDNGPLFPPTCHQYQSRQESSDPMFSFLYWSGGGRLWCQVCGCSVCVYSLPPPLYIVLSSAFPAKLPDVPVGRCYKRGQGHTHPLSLCLALPRQRYWVAYHIAEGKNPLRVLMYMHVSWDHGRLDVGRYL